MFPPFFFLFVFFFFHVGRRPSPLVTLPRPDGIVFNWNAKLGLDKPPKMTQNILADVVGVAPTTNMTFSLFFGHAPSWPTNSNNPKRTHSCTFFPKQLCCSLRCDDLCHINLCLAVRLIVGHECRSSVCPTWRFSCCTLSVCWGNGMMVLGLAPGYSNLKRPLDSATSTEWKRLRGAL